MKKGKKDALLYSPFVKHRKTIDRSFKVSNLEGSFELLHADIANIISLIKSAIDPKYFFLVVGLLNSKIRFLWLKTCLVL